MSLFSGRENSGTDIRRGAVLFIGPIPIILGMDKGYAITIAVLAVILMVFAYFFMKR
ncbi:MAG: DUF131 domain-containing protein [Candidatus Altiarchaeia archaeon]